jgi:hypothetical protein
LNASSAKVSTDRAVIGDTLDHLLRDPPDAVVPGEVLVLLGVPTPVDDVAGVRLVDLPGVSAHQPVVGLFDLPALVDLLVEDPELVADPVSDRRSFERRQRVEIAGGQPAEAAVAQSGFLLARHDLVQLLAQRRQRLAGLGLDAEVQQVVAELRAHQELGRQVTGHLAGLFEPVLGGRHPALLHPVAHRERQSAVVVLCGQCGGGPGDREREVVADPTAQRVGRQTGAAVLVDGGRRRCCGVEISHVHHVGHGLLPVSGQLRQDAVSHHRVSARRDVRVPHVNYRSSADVVRVERGYPRKA